MRCPCETPHAHLCVVQLTCPWAFVVFPDPLYSGNYQQIEALALESLDPASEEQVQKPPAEDHGPGRTSEVHVTLNWVDVHKHVVYKLIPFLGGTVQLI